jgi:hypothetical protein
VIIAGQVRKRQGQLVGVDLNRLRQQAQASRDYIAQKAGWPSTRIQAFGSKFSATPLMQ